jgi:hypothetical protein
MKQGFLTQKRCGAEELSRTWTHQEVTSTVSAEEGVYLPFSRVLAEEGGYQLSANDSQNDKVGLMNKMQEANLSAALSYVRTLLQRQYMFPLCLVPCFDCLCSGFHHGRNILCFLSSSE